MRMLKTNLLKMVEGKDDMVKGYYYPSTDNLTDNEVLVRKWNNPEP